MERSAIPLAIVDRATWTPSRRLQTAALRDRERIERKLAEIDRRHAKLVAALEETAATRDELRDQLAMLNRLVHDPDPAGAGAQEEASPSGSAGSPESEVLEPPRQLHDVPPGATVLRGQAIREAAVQVLAASPRVFEPIHYREWFELLQEGGLVPAGKDPLATFLTQLGRSPVVRRSGEQGVYVLDHDFPARARKRLEQLRNELRDAHDAPVGADAAELGALRKRRIELAAETERLERELEEALRSLTPEEQSLRSAS